ncbi:MAG: hypothetical protein GF344_10900 [Chitinivibrionales bacterium]|nr:hypothetical protein [Chitinivibrionales bacterium]MBD3357311.1 hypothetical protein [Chitinivibrionales bacterium]
MQKQAIATGRHGHVLQWKAEVLHRRPSRDQGHTFPGNGKAHTITFRTKRVSFMNQRLPIPLVAVILSIAVTVPSAAESRRQEQVTGGPLGAYPYLLKGVSRKNLLERHPWSILHGSSAGTDTLHIAAVRIEFQKDTSELTTGNGLFGINTNGGTSSDEKESKYYRDNVYKYDDLEHDSTYFANQLKFVRNYFAKVSRGKLHVDYSIYPSGVAEAYQVPHRMTRYSPGGKLPQETWDEYYARRTEALMQFIKDAVMTVDTSETAEEGSPFTGLRIDTTSRPGTPMLRDSLGRKTALLIIHAGASYLTDGGYEGFLGQDTPSDMIDAFISPDFFDYYQEELGFDTLTIDGKKRTGVKVNNGRLLVDEVMMVSETSNQDSLNWGIHGILVNQVARQLGIPDLFSTTSGISGVGAFCIMDFAGYSAGNGFIPPWPSAWVRAFMGWDNPVVADIAAGGSYNLTAVNAADENDTTILLVPINDHEYYLIENRQRNLGGERSAFNYETTDETEHIDAYNPVNLESNVVETSDNSSVILEVDNYDVGLPASGLLVWHVDEDRVRDRFEWNILNIDSLYRAISLEEADGIQDLGVEFTDIFYQASFDYGGAEDVFPHKRRDEKTIIREMGPFTRPTTQSNDGGHTYLKLTVEKPSDDAPKEFNAIRDYFVINYADSVVGVTVEFDPPGAQKKWRQPRMIVPGTFFEPALCDVAGDGNHEIALLDTEGRLYVWDLIDGVLRDGSLGTLTDSVRILTLRGDTATWIDSTTGDTTNSYLPVNYLARIEAPFTFPTTIDGKLYIPSGKVIHVVGKNKENHAPTVDTIAVGKELSSYVCNYRDEQWAVGCADGSIIGGSGMLITDSITVAKDRRAPVQALAVVDSTAGTLAAVDTAGLVGMISFSDGELLDTIRLSKGIPPYTLATGDLNRCDTDTSLEIVVCDGRQGLWLLETVNDLKPAPDWALTPNDWAAYYSFIEDTSDTRRSKLPHNSSAPSLADLDGDGALDIVVGGTNGVYALSARGALLTNAWPAYLDNRYWYQRGVINTSPTVATDDGGKPMVLFSTPTGENITIAVGDIDSTLKSKGKVYYTTSEGHSDSITDLESSFIDTLLTVSDSVMFPYVLPGGFVDARNSSGERPVFRTVSLPNVGRVAQSYWPLTVGGSAESAPLLCDMDRDSDVDILAVSTKGRLYRWEFDSEVVGGPMVWPQTGCDGARSFTYRGPAPTCSAPRLRKVTTFYSYPNPSNGADEVTFRYELSGEASKVRLDIFTYTGYHAYSAENLSTYYPGPNEYRVALRNFGSAVYRCRLEATFGDKSDIVYWKMAVVR